MWQLLEYLALVTDPSLSVLVFEELHIASLSSAYAALARYKAQPLCIAGAMAGAGIHSVSEMSQLWPVGRLTQAAYCTSGKQISLPQQSLACLNDLMAQIFRQVLVICGLLQGTTTVLTMHGCIRSRGGLAEEPPLGVSGKTQPAVGLYQQQRHAETAD